MRTGSSSKHHDKSDSRKTNREDRIENSWNTLRVCFGGFVESSVIIEDSELGAVQDFLDESRMVFENWPRGSDDREERIVHDVDFFLERPHLVLPLTFDQRLFQRPAKDVGLFKGATFGLFEHELLLRRASSGVWTWIKGLTMSSTGEIALRLMPERGDQVDYPVTKWMDDLTSLRYRIDDHPRVLLMQKLWSPRSQLAQQLALAERIPNLLRRISDQQTRFEDLHWRDLEELVAELLRSSGWRIDLTRKSKDGGRDIVAEGELDGEPTVLAVEVRKKSVVEVAEVRAALKANEDFPQLMVVTTGRFSAGVHELKRDKKHWYRLRLRDGVALANWIQDYCST